jgi:hypothetical protein
VTSPNVLRSVLEDPAVADPRKNEAQSAFHADKVLSQDDHPLHLVCFEARKGTVLRLVRAGSRRRVSLLVAAGHGLHAIGCQQGGNALLGQLDASLHQGFEIVKTLLEADWDQ